jgi:hypothetical protein
VGKKSFLSCTAAAVYICIALEPVILQLICTQNLVQVLHRYNISQVTACTQSLCQGRPPLH